ncbi:hypothetical protein Tco_0296150 [Tanacetum coccineum]
MYIFLAQVMLEIRETNCATIGTLKVGKDRGVEFNGAYEDTTISKDATQSDEAKRSLKAEWVSSNILKGRLEFTSVLSEAVFFNVFEKSFKSIVFVHKGYVRDKEAAVATLATEGCIAVWSLKAIDDLIMVDKLPKDEAKMRLKEVGLSKEVTEQLSVGIGVLQVIEKALVDHFVHGVEFIFIYQNNRGKILVTSTDEVVE